MLDNVYPLLKLRRIRQFELKIEIGKKWSPTTRLENLAFTNEFDGVIKDTVMQYYMKHIQQLIYRDGISS